MRRSNRSSWLAAACLVTLPGCASFDGLALGQGFRAGVTPGLGFALAPSSCSLVGSSSELALRSGAAAQAFSRRQQISAIQARLSPGSRSVGMPGWKRLAETGC